MSYTRLTFLMTAKRRGGVVRCRGDRALACMRAFLCRVQR